MKEENRESNAETRLASFDRRGLIKKSAANVVGLSLISGTVTADQKNDGTVVNGDEYVTETNHQEEEYYYSVTYNNWYRIESTIRCLGGYSKSNGMWGTTFRNSAYGPARRYDPNNETPEQGKKSAFLTNTPSRTQMQMTEIRVRSVTSTIQDISVAGQHRG